MSEEPKDHVIRVYDSGGKWVGNVGRDGTYIVRKRIHTIYFTALRAHEIADQMKHDNPQYEFAAGRSK